jgi:hypothetical protein
MRRPRAPVAIFVALLALPVSAGVAAAQATPPSPEPVGAELLGRAVGSLVGTLLAGGAALVLAPDYSADVVERVRRRPAATTVVGVATLIGVLIATIALALTVVGLVVVIPGLVVFGVIAAVAGALGWVAVGRTLLGGTASLASGLLVGSVLSVLIGVVPILGGLLAFLVSSAGMGAVVTRYLDEDSGRGGAADPTAVPTGAGSRH